MSIELTDNYDDYDKEKLKLLHGMLEYINSKVKEDGICRFYDSKLNVVANGSTQDKAYERFQKYIKENNPFYKNISALKIENKFNELKFKLGVQSTKLNEMTQKLDE